MQKQADSSPLSVAFYNLKDHFEPFLRAGLSHSQSQQNAAQASMVHSSSLSSLPSRYGSLFGLASRSKSMPTPKDDLDSYQSQNLSKELAQDEEQLVQFMHDLTDMKAVMRRKDRWMQVWERKLASS
jgi:hypothetical protein